MGVPPFARARSTIRPVPITSPYQNALALEPASAIAVINEEIAAHELAARELRTRRNSYSPTSKFPNELMSEIFIIAKAMSTVPLSYGETRNRRGGWLNVAGVCLAWRDIALNTLREMDASRVKSLEWTSTTLQSRAPIRRMHVGFIGATATAAPGAMDHRKGDLKAHCQDPVVTYLR
ncbi:hypothetical protein BDN71DRAFT_794570 [Pleurotus eryngii]|uniref:F-box domain-containing protein n=1 Tax=Pleurotus eryngii TaxID=5323 RepID=A0A9P6A2C1_PLEER|nr:hypothetical protein BDN71DRAFT_794570 [Pleurotus eryngii]